MPNPDQMAPLRKKLLFSIWLLSKQESFLSASDRFDLAASTGHAIFTEIIMLVASLLPQFITWPDANTYEATAGVLLLHDRYSEHLLTFLLL